MLEDTIRETWQVYVDYPARTVAQIPLQQTLAAMDVIAAARLVVEQLLGERDRVGEFLPGIFDLNEALGEWDKLEDKHA